MIGDNLYLWGGNDVPSVHNNDEKRRLTSQIAIFNITSGIWNSRPTNGSPPLGVKGYLCTSSNGKIYFFGGSCNHDTCYHNSLNELDISTLNWTQLQPTDDNIIVMKRAYGGIMSSEQAGHHCLLVIGGLGSPSIQLPQAQYYQVDDGVAFTNEQNIYDLITGKNINISYYIIRYHFNVTTCTVIIVNISNYKLGIYGLYFLQLKISMCVVLYNYGSLHSLKYNMFYV